MLFEGLSPEQQSIYDNFHRAYSYYKSTTEYREKEEAKEAFLDALGLLFLQYPSNNKNVFIDALLLIGQYPLKTFSTNAHKLSGYNIVQWNETEMHISPLVSDTATQFQIAKANLEGYKQLPENSYLEEKASFVQQFGKIKMKRLKKSVEIFRC